MEKVFYRHNARQPPEFGQAPGLLQKLPFFILKNAVLFPCHHNQTVALAVLPSHKFIGVIFFNGQLHPQIQVISHIGNPEAALAQCPPRQVFAV